jgi:two-component system sensor histidine kinase VanS
VWVRTRTNANDAIVSVENTGEWISPQVAATLVEPFARGGRIRTDHAGAGLGLAIVDRITQAHNGALSIAPRPEGGLCVTVTLPAATA